MLILLSGSTGFVGKATLSYFSKKGHIVHCLQRGQAPPSVEYDAVIHLSGEPIFGRWTVEKKRRILESRIHPLPVSTKVFLSASAVGFYGDRGDEILTEESSPGTGFLADVCKQWELTPTCGRVVRARFGIVLGKGGGVLKKMITPYKLGLGAVIGSGKQWISWIALEDLIAAIEFCLVTPSVSGAVNFVAPHPVRQEAFAREVATALHRKVHARLPAWLIKLIFGQMGVETMLSSARVEPILLIKNGFRFKFSTIKDAITRGL